MAKQRYFLVLNRAGAFIDDYFYAEGEVAPYNPSEAEDKAGKPFWGQECDEHGSVIGASKNPDYISDKQADSFVAAQTGNTSGGTSGNTGSTGGQEGDGELTAEQKNMIAEAGNLLEADNDTHWTKSGYPSASALSTIIGFKVTANQVKEVLPELKRPA